LVGGGAAAGAWPNRLLPTRKGSATMAAIAARRYPSAFNICDLISFSIGVWLGLAGRIKEEFPPDKRFFHFFSFFFERLWGSPCPLFAAGRSPLRFSAYALTSNFKAMWLKNCLSILPRRPSRIEPWNRALRRSWTECPLKNRRLTTSLGEMHRKTRPLAPFTILPNVAGKHVHGSD